MKRIRWKRSDEGYVESHCGDWFINPLYCGTTRPVWYELRDCRDGRYIKRGTHETQADAKDEAERVLRVEGLRN